MTSSAPTAPRLLLMGPPGSGKGTQAQLLSERLGVPTVSTGDLFRRHVSERSELGVQVSELVSSGGYVPDEITNRMVAERLAEPDMADGFILDGYPRTIAQVEELDRLLDETPLQAVVLLEADPAVLVGRLAARATSESRSDDTAEVILQRIDLYERETAPLAEQYSRRRLLHRVGSDGEPHEVAEAIVTALGV